MLIELYILFEIIMIILFFVSFYTKQELMWTMTLVICGVLMFTSYNVEVLGYDWTNTTNSYALTTVSYSYPYLMGLNLIFLSLALLLGLFDLFDKYKDGFSK